MSPKRLIHGMLRSVLIAGGCLMAQSASALYVGMYAIGDFVPSASGGCGQEDRSSWPGMAQAWWDKMGDLGHYKGSSSNPYKYVNGNMTVKRFCDPSTYDSDCRDYQSSSPSGADWMDAVIIATHGYDDGDHWGAIMRYPWKSECSIRMGGSSDMVKMGDSWAQFIHASSCQSADDDNLSGIRHAMEDTSTSSTRRAHQFTGFHGIMYISSSYNGNYRETASDGHVVSTGYSWVTNHFKSDKFQCAAYDPFNWFGTCQDQCPIALSIGSSGSDAQTRLYNERYNYTYSDPSDNSHYWYYYYAGCDPVGETTFTP